MLHVKHVKHVHTYSTIDPTVVSAKRLDVGKYFIVDVACRVVGSRRNEIKGINRNKNFWEIFWGRAF